MRRSGFLQATAILVGGSAVAQAIPVLLTPVLTRLYQPDDMGMLGLYIAFISFATHLTTLGYSLAIPAAPSERDAAGLTVISVAVVLPAAVIGAACFWLLISRSWLGYGSLPALMPMFALLSLTLTGMYFSLRYWLVRKGMYPLISKATIAQSIGRAIPQVALGSTGFGASGLVAGEVVGRAFGLLTMWIATWNEVRERTRTDSTGELMRLAARYCKFPLVSVPSSLLNSLALVLPVPLIAANFDVGAGGQFSVASRVLLLPMGLIGVSVGDVFLNRIGAYSRERPERALAFMLRVSGSLFLAGVIPMVTVAMYGEELWTLVLGDRWATAGLMASAIAPWALMQLAVSPVSRLVMVYQAQESKLIYDVLALGSIVGVLKLGADRRWGLVDTISVLGWTQALVYGVYFLVLVMVVRRHRKPV